MSKELIEQLAKKAGILKYKTPPASREYHGTIEQLEAFAKAYAQTQGKSETDILRLAVDEGRASIIVEAADSSIDGGVIFTDYQDAIDSINEAHPINNTESKGI